jgi:hypothetical protein
MEEKIDIQKFNLQIEKISKDEELINVIKKYIKEGKLNKTDKLQNEFIQNHFEILTTNNSFSNPYLRAKKRLISYCQK